MILILISLVAGIILGYSKLFGPKDKEKVMKLQKAGLYLLVFSMGLAIGNSKEIIENIKEVGINAIFISLSSIVFSILMVYITDRYIISRKKEKVWKIQLL